LSAKKPRAALLKWLFCRLLALYHAYYLTEETKAFQKNSASTPIQITSVMRSPLPF